MKRLLVGANPRRTLIRAAATTAAAFVLFGYVLLPVRLHGVSMLPTYHEGAINFADRFTFWRRDPARGDVVAIRMAGRRAMYVKRIVGLPHERLEIVGGVVLVNGLPIDEPTVVHRAPWTLPAFVLGPDEYFVVGDNRGMPIEHHDLGRARRDRIVGRMLF